jgi:hypothetical protein
VKSVVDAPELKGWLVVGLVRVATPFSVEADATDDESAASESESESETEPATASTARQARPPLPALRSDLRIVMTSAFRSLRRFSGTWVDGTGAGDQPLPWALVEPQVPSPEVRLSKPKSWAVDWAAVEHWAEPVPTNRAFSGALKLMPESVRVGTTV